MVSEETKTLITLITITRHRELVAHYLRGLAYDLIMRAENHDLSKLQVDEFEGFVAINKIAREHPFGSPEYRQSLSSQKDVIRLHYSRNRHHPEYHNGGLYSMSLVDLIEMIADWKAAAVTYGQTSLEESFEIQKNRYGISPEIGYLLSLVIATLEGL